MTRIPPHCVWGGDFRGTPNATKRVTAFRKPGKKRASFFRYFHINLPRATRALLIVLLAAIGGASVATVPFGHEPFQFAGVLLWLLGGLTAVFVVVGVVTKLRFWTAALVVPISALLIYIGGVFGNAPYVWNGGTLVDAATWNLLLIVSAVYLVLYAAIQYGIFAVYPDGQNFLD